MNDGETLDLSGRTLQFFHTEGHARHHYCVVDRKTSGVFTGDSFGVSYREFDGPRGEFVFASTVPTQFDPDAAHASIDRILSWGPRICYLAHYGPVTNVPRLAAELHESLDLFVSIALQWEDHPERTERLESAMFDFFSRSLAERDVAIDPGRLRSLLGIDLWLNVQGLEFWLDHRH